MKTIRGRVGTTHLDKDGERMSREALEDMARHFSERYIPVGVEHDIRLPPIGRIVSGEVVPLEDGEFALDVEREEWEVSDTPGSLQGDGRTIPLDTNDSPTFRIIYDRSFNDDEGKQFISELADLAANRIEPEFTIKKAVEPISTLAIAAGAFVLGGIAAGFFNKLGSDMYDSLKEKLKKFYGGRRSREQLLDFRLITEASNHRFEVHLLIENPSPEVIDSLFHEQFRQIDGIVQDLYDPNLATIVVEWRPGKMQLLYCLTSDGVPVGPKKPSP